jgi:[acyl-carrier-protein] S-malonyltransferase
MGRDFYDAQPAAREVFAAASEALKLDLQKLCFESDSRLELTQFAQPAIVTVEIAMLRAIEAEFGLRPGRFGGHSLGEYSALVAAGVIDIADAVVLVHERGRLMQEAVALGEGAMIAVVQPGLDLDALRAGLGDIPVDVANINSPDQVVLSGRKADIDRATAAVREIPGFERARSLPLKVSAPFHSRWMEPAERALRPLLEANSTRWNVTNACTVACNVSGEMHESNAGKCVDQLAYQVSAPVRWLDNMRVLAAEDSKIYEIGPGKPLRAFFSAIGVEVTPITTWASAIVLGSG